MRDGRPVVTFTVMGLCVLLYLLQRVSGGSVTEALVYAPFLTAVDPWRALTAAFLHSPGNILHIALNLYALYLTGPYLEQVLGRLRFAALYLLAALGGSVGVLLLASPLGGSWYTGTVGASGAVFGLFGALLVVQRRLGRGTGQIVAVILVNGVLGFVVPGIAWQAHLGGLLTGAAVAAVLVHAPARSAAPARPAGSSPTLTRRDGFQLAGSSAVLALLVVGSLLKLVAAGAL